MPYHKVFQDKGVSEWLSFYLDYDALKKLITPFKDLYKG